MGPANLCPYVGCTKAIAYGAAPFSCACDHRLPVSLCPKCGTGNRTGAAFCRRCHVELSSSGTTPRDLDNVQPSFTTVPGDFRRGPLFLHGSMYAVSTDGVLHGVSLRNDAKARALGAMDPAAAFNQAALVKVLPKGSTQPGWAYVGISPQKIETISLVTGESRVLYEAPNGAEIAVNSVGSGTRFRGVAATGHLFAFSELAGIDKISLVVCGFSGKLPVERPMTIDGTSAMGPVLTDDCLALCSLQMIGVYDMRYQKTLQMPLPPQFEPLLVRKQGGINIPVGSVPLTIVRGAAGIEAWIGGEEYGNPGFLVVELERRQWRFERTPRVATVASNLDGTLSVAAEDEVRILGTKGWKSERLNLQPGMPAVAADGLLLSFVESGRIGRHNVTLSQPGRGAVGTLTFDDPQCRAETVCGAAIIGNDIAVSYLPQGSERGFTVARWNLEQSAARPS